MSSPQPAPKNPEALQQEINDLMTNAIPEIRMDRKAPEDRQELLDFIANQHHYSMGNIALIRSQYEGAQYVASYKAWAAQGWHVRKGEHAIKILVPKSFRTYLDVSTNQYVVFSKLDESTQNRVKAHDSNVATRSGLYYTLGNVFDVTQTNAKPKDYPKIFPNRPFEFANEHPEQVQDVIKALKDVASRLGVPVTTTDSTHFPTVVTKLGVAKGAAISDEQGRPVEIFMKQGLSSEEYAATLIHEIAHVQLHNSQSKDISKFWDTHDVLGDTYQGIKELQAEMTSYVVSKSIGIDTSERAKPYIADWTENFQTVDGAPEQQQVAIMADIQRSANSIIEGLNNSLNLTKSQNQTQAVPKTQTVVQQSQQALGR